MNRSFVTAGAQVASVSAKVDRVEQGGVEASPQLDQLLNLAAALGSDFENSNQRALHRGSGQPLRRLVHGQTGDFMLVGLEDARRLGGAVLGQAYVGALHEARLDGRETEQLALVVAGRDLAEATRVIARVECEQLLTLVGKREHVDLVVQDHHQLLVRHLDREHLRLEGELKDELFEEVVPDEN